MTIYLKKTITPEALAAMSRNTIVEGGAIDADVMTKFNKVLADRLAKIPNATLKKAVEESIRETATNQLVKATPSTVEKIVDDSFAEITKALGIAPPKPAPAPEPAWTPPPRRSGGK